MDRDSRPHFPEVASEYSQAFLEHWVAEREPKIVPDFAALNSARISDLLPWIQWLEQRADGSFRWRSLGEGIATLFGGETSGQTMNPESRPCHDRRFLAVYTAVVGQPCGAVIRCLGGTAGGRLVTLETLALPLLDDVGRPTRIVAYSEVLDLEPCELQRSGRIVGLAIQGFDFLDIGKGKPSGCASWRNTTREKDLASPE